MWTIIVITAIALFIAIYQEYNSYYSDFEDYILVSIPAILIGGIIGTAVAFALPAKTEIVKTTYNLEALQDNNSVKGSFFLGSGQIEGKMKYVFYYENEGYYKLEQADYNEVKVKYSDEKPKAERFKRKNVKDAFINNFAIDFNCYQEYIIYVPKGTIKQNYSLDAQ
ncbi:MAG: hypothetical protein PHC38_10710 [Weeksellaceae bacterium]|nr:hypothetical protein [Weeksellaceae bacterium]